MPAANFGRSDYLTIALLLKTEDFESDPYVQERAMEIWEDNNPDWEEEGLEPDLDEIINDLVWDDMNESYRECMEETEEQISQLDLSYISVDIRSGYYEGIYLDITMDYTLYTAEEREELYAEIGKFGEFLIELANTGWRTVYSSAYTTSMDDYDETCENIASAISEMIQEGQESTVYDDDEPSDWVY